MFGINSTSSFTAKIKRRKKKKTLRSAHTGEDKVAVTTYSLINSTAASYLSPSSIKASATSTGARPSPATQWTATHASGSSWNLYRKLRFIGGEIALLYTELGRELRGHRTNRSNLLLLQDLEPFHHDLVRREGTILER